MNKKLIKNKNILTINDKKMNKETINIENDVKKVSKTNKKKLGQFLRQIINIFFQIYPFQTI